MANIHSLLRGITIIAAHHIDHGGSLVEIANDKLYIRDPVENPLGEDEVAELSALGWFIEANDDSQSEWCFWD